MRMPNLFIAGAPRCGTSSIFTYLNEHPQVFMSSVKEPAFFGSDLHFPHRRTPRMHFRDYMSLFVTATREPIDGEASTCYFYSHAAAQEIAEFNPNAKVIIMLRSPVEMMVSLHNYLYCVGKENLADFGAALDAEDARRRGERLPPGLKITESLSYRAIASYGSHLKRFFDVFGRARVHVVIFDDFAAQPAKVFREVLLFLGIDPNHHPTFARINSSPHIRNLTVHRLLNGAPIRFIEQLAPRALTSSVHHRARRWNTTFSPPPPLSDELRQRLQSELAPELAKVASLLGRDLSPWRGSVTPAASA
jgi:hypothetical protein